MVLTIFTSIHVLISLVGLFSGFIVLYGLLVSKRLDGWTALFLAATIATTLTGYLFPVHRFLPSHVVGFVSLVALALATYARYARRMDGIWRGVYVIDAIIALYLNVFVAIAQAFMKIPELKMLAPTQSEPPFKLTELAVLVLFIILATIATMRFRDQPAEQREDQPNRSTGGLA
jgi:hypothetical protein